MEEHFFVHFKATNQAGERINQLLYFRGNDTKEAEAFLQNWLTQSCGLTCVPEGTIENGGLPEGTFVCPAVTVPADLDKYSEQPVTGIELQVKAIYNFSTARQFKNAAMDEYYLDQIFTPMSDEMSAILTGVKESFDPNYSASVNLEYILTFINQLLTKGGLSKF